MVKVGIIGGSGYTGGELLRLLVNHPQVQIKSVTSRTHKGKPVWELFPNLRSFTELTFDDVEPDSLAEQCDIVFTAVPHGVTFGIAPVIRHAGKRLIDLGADYRFRDLDNYETWYKVKHEDPDGALEAVYGLPELLRDRIAGANLVANPGCYPTSAILGAAPLLSNGIVDLQGITIDSKSGVSGSGRNLRLSSLFSECSSNFNPYGAPGHRHTPEIEQAFSAIAGEEVRVTFAPHLLPVVRGILTTMYFLATCDITQKELDELYTEYYRNEYFVRVCISDLPEIKAVQGSNFCDIAVRLDERTQRIMVVSAIDNLVKGASGQAIQNMNIMFGIEETTSLRCVPIFP
jgi:N-acetyl-gamma-glutamyl-phosphate reductase